MTRRRIDHLVLAVHDLEAAADFYRRLGFQVGARNRHPWGTENRLVQMRSSFLELISLGGDPAAIPSHGAGVFSFGGFLRDYLQRRQGLAMLVLDSDDARADAQAFDASGIGRFQPFHFARKGRRPDGSETQVAFTLAFAMDPRLPDAAFFVCQQHDPQAFWNPEFQNHPNGAENVRAVTLAVGAPSRHADFMAEFAGTPPQAGPDDAVIFALREAGRIEMVSDSGPARLSAYRVTVRDLAPLAERLRDQAIRFGVDAQGLVIDESGAFGVAIRFEEAG